MALGFTPIELVESGDFPLLTKHDSWGRISLENVATVQNGYAFQSSNFTKNIGVPLIRIRDINNTDTEDYYDGKYPNEYLVKSGDILIGMDGDFNLARWKGEKALLNQRVCRVIPFSKYYDDKFLVYVLPSFLKAINERTSSVTVKHLSSRTLNEIPLPLPPLTEQYRIVAKIEELFSSLDKGVETLKAAQQQLKVYRQAVLKWAFEGRLTHPDLKEGELPEGWVDKNMGDYINSIDAGKSFRCDERRPSKNDYGVLKVSAVTWGIYNEDESKTVLDKEKIRKEYIVNRGDFIISRANTLELVGAVVIAENVSGKMMLSDKTLRLKFSDGLVDKYALYFLRSKSGRDQIQKLSTGNQESMRNIGQKAINAIKIILPSSSNEQVDLVSEIESRLSVCDKIEESIEQGLQQAEALRQSILKKAFEGKLVPQDPNDEPASVLLERIKAERDGNFVQKASKKKRSNLKA